LQDCFGDLHDPRRDSALRKHLLLDILAIALCAMLSSAESFVDMAEYGRSKEAWLRERLGLSLPHGVPSHDTFGRLFARLNPAVFTRCFIQWTQALATLTQGQVIALDGKTLRHSFDTATGQAALHLVSAWASDNRLLLAQEPVDAKSNEITAVPALLEMLDIKGCVVTGDAMLTQKTIAEQIVDQGGDYVLALKDNHACLHQDVADFVRWLEQRPGGLAQRSDSQAQTREWGHGRKEVRRCWCLDAQNGDWPQAVRQWKGLKSLVVVERERALATPEAEAPAPYAPAQVERHYFLSSLAPQAPRLLQAVREHWGVENRLHWVLDVVFDEDASRVRKDHAAHNLATLRRLALNLLRQDTKHKHGLKARRHRAGWDNDYLLQVLCSAFS
jgi:predicted transposase YbfD/YdcC